MPEWRSVSSEYIAPQLQGEPDAWSKEAGGRGSQILREVTEDAPPPEVAQIFGQGVAVVRRRLILFDDRPIELADSYYPVSVARGTPLAEPRKIRGGAVTLLAELGHRITSVTEVISARMPTAQERDLLAIAEGEPVLVQLRDSRDGNGAPIEVSVMTMIGEGRSLRYEMTV